MARIKSGLIKGLQELLGISAGGVAGPVDVDLANVSQTLPIVPELARRGLAPGTIGGWGFGLLENVHAGADGEASFIDPYRAAGSAIQGYPRRVQQGFDVWLLGAAAIRSSGGGDITEALLQLNPVASQQMWGKDDAGAAVVGDPTMGLIRWDDLSTAISVGTDYLVTEDGQPYVKLGIRIPRSGCTISFRTEAAAAAEFQCICLMGLFPAAMGQDVVT